MTVKKISVSLDSAVTERARLAAEREGIPLSAWLSRAAEEAANLADARAALAEYIETYGEPDEQLMEESRERLRAAGVGQPETSAETSARHAALARLYGSDSRQEPAHHEYRRAG